MINERRAELQARIVSGQNRIATLNKWRAIAEQYCSFLQGGPFPDYIQTADPHKTLGRMKRLVDKTTGRQGELLKHVESEILPKIQQRVDSTASNQAAIGSYLAMEQVLGSVAADQAYNTLTVALITKKVGTETRVSPESEVFRYPNGGKAKGYVARVLRFLDPLAPDATEKKKPPTTREVIEYAYRRGKDVRDKGHGAIARARENLERNTEGRLTIVIESTMGDRSRGIAGTVSIKEKNPKKPEETRLPSRSVSSAAPETSPKRRRSKDRLYTTDEFVFPDGDRVTGVRATILKIFQPFTENSGNVRHTPRKVSMEVYKSGKRKDYGRLSAHFSKINTLLEKYDRKIASIKDRKGRIAVYFNQSLGLEAVKPRTSRPEVILPLIYRILTEPDLTIDQVREGLGTDRRGGVLGWTQLLSTLAGGLIRLEIKRQKAEKGVKNVNLSEHERRILEVMEGLISEQKLTGRWDLFVKVLQFASPMPFPHRWERSEKPYGLSPSLAQRLHDVFLK